MKKIFKIFGKVGVLVLCLVLLINLVCKDQSKSFTEQRSLQMFPKFSEVTLDEYTSQMTSWFSDQFVGRDSLIHLKYLTQKVLGVRKIDDVYLGKHCLIQETAEMNQEAVDKNIEAINNFFVKNNVNTMFLLANTAVGMNNDKLPRNAFELDQNKQMDYVFNHLDPNIARIDVRDTLKSHKDEYLYYKSDHHWTTLAAYYATQEIAEYMNFDLPGLDSFHKYPITYDFKGTLAKKTGSLMQKDEVDIYVPKKNVDYVVTYAGAQEKKRTVYNSKAISSADQYAVFFGGNQDLIQIDVNNESEHHLLVFKDSYANALIPFLIPYFRTITIVDPRYYTENVNRVVRSQMITDVLYVYNSNTFVGDTSLMDVLNEEAE